MTPSDNDINWGNHRGDPYGIPYRQPPRNPPMPCTNEYFVCGIRVALGGHYDPRCYHPREYKLILRALRLLRLLKDTKSRQTTISRWLK